MNTFPIHIRAAAASDRILLAHMGRQTFYDSFAAANIPENIQDYLDSKFGPHIQSPELADPASTFLIAEIDGTPVGYAHLKLGPPPAGISSGQNPIEIGRFYSIKEWIGRGIGPALMQACLETAQHKGCDVVWLDVWEENPRAIAFYRKWGFQEAGKQIFVLGNDPQHDLIMQRWLKE